MQERKKCLSLQILNGRQTQLGFICDHVGIQKKPFGEILQSNKIGLQKIIVKFKNIQQQQIKKKLQSIKKFTIQKQKKLKIITKDKKSNHKKQKLHGSESMAYFLNKCISYKKNMNGLLLSFYAGKACCQNKQLYLLGSINNRIQFIKINLVTLNIKHFNTPKCEGIFGHTMNIYKNELIIVGGQSCYQRIMKKRIQYTLQKYSIEDQRFNNLTKYIELEPKKYHIAQIIVAEFYKGNSIYIHGGQKNPVIITSQLVRVNLKTFSVEKMLYTPQLFLCNHSSTAIYQDKYNPFFSGKTTAFSLIKDKEGLYLFGGRKQSHEISNQLWVANVNKITHIQFKLIVSSGKKPSPRYGHIMQFCISIKCLVIFGGDLWMLRLQNMQWVYAKMEGDYIGARYLHCSCINDTELYILGGIGRDGFCGGQLNMIDLNEKNLGRRLLRNSINNLTYK